MKQFITRVELHAGDGASYEILHKEMQKQQFSHIVSVNGARKMLPTAEYYLATKDTVTMKDVALMAQTAAEATKKKFMIVATEANCFYCLNLLPETKAP